MPKNDLSKNLWDWWGAIVGLWKRLKDTRELILWIVALGGLPTATLAAYWKATDSDLPVNIRLLLFGLLLLSAGFVVLLWFSRRKEKEIARLEKLVPQKDAPRTAAQDMILEVLWKHPGIGLAGVARYVRGLDVRLLEHNLKLLKKDGYIWQDAYSKWQLNLVGEQYVVGRNLHNERGQYFDNDAPDVPENH